MDSDIILRLKTPDGPLVLLPYPVVTVDMGQQLARMKGPTEIEILWEDYVLELAIIDFFLIIMRSLFVIPLCIIFLFIIE